MRSLRQTSRAAGHRREASVQGDTPFESRRPPSAWPRWRSRRLHLMKPLHDLAAPIGESWSRSTGTQRLCPRLIPAIRCGIQIWVAGLPRS